jgi:hypothetical protein
LAGTSVGDVRVKNVGGRELFIEECSTALDDLNAAERVRR